MKRTDLQNGFTLMEIIIATAIFAIVVTSTLALFNTVLSINRQVQAIRQVSQASRNFTEVLSREIRNGRIDYAASANCTTQYNTSTNQFLAIVSYTGEKLCFYLTNTNGVGDLKLKRTNSSGASTDESIIPANISVNPATFRFLVRPSVAWNDPLGNKAIQPMVSVLVEFQINRGARNQKVIPYQTTISTDIYDIPNIND